MKKQRSSAKKPRKNKTAPKKEKSQSIRPEPDKREKEAIDTAKARVDAREPRFDMRLDLDHNSVVQGLGSNHSDAAGWAMRLQDAFGTRNLHFPIMAVNQLIAASRDIKGKIDVSSLNAMLAIVDGARPANEQQAMLACQMAITHRLAMKLMVRAEHADQIPQVDCAGNLAVKRLRTFTAQTEALAKLQRDHSQTVRVEHVHVYSGGQAIVGNVGNNAGQSAPRGRGQDEKCNQPHAKEQLPAPGAAPMPEMQCEDTKREPLPVAGSDRERPLPNARRRQG